MLNVIGGLDGIDDGEIVVNGRALSSLTDKEYDAYRNTFIGFIFQEYNLLSDYTVEKNICIANELQGRKTDKEYFNHLLDLVGINGLEKRKPSQLSGGQKQRVAIARALIKNPSIIMADEPTGALDSQTGIQVMNVLKKLSKEKLVIVVSHDIELAEKYADRIVRIKDGEVESDTTLTTKILEGNIYENNDTLTIKAKTVLNDKDLQVVKHAVFNGKSIDVKDTVEIREKEPSPKIIVKRPKNPSAFINSKMKFKSSAELGAKSLGVKPLRLFFTILLSAIAFAVFGVFDTIAAYSRGAIASNIISTGDYSAISLSATHYQESSNKTINVNLNKEYMVNINSQSGYKFRPVYSFNKQKQETLMSDTKVSGNNFSTKVLEAGNYFYSDMVNGFVEFDPDTEISGEVGNRVLDKDGYNYKIIAGAYPKLADNLANQGIGVSKYLMDSLWHFYKGQDNVNYTSNDVLGTKITLNGIEYSIQCVIDCGEIPLKYQTLKYQTKDTLDALLKADFQTFINSGLHLNCFLPKGYFDAVKAENNGAKYYFSDAKYEVFEFSVKSPHHVSPYVNNGGDNQFKFIKDSEVKQSNVYYFSETNGLKTGDMVNLQDNEVIINFWNYYDIYEALYPSVSTKYMLKTELQNKLVEAVQYEDNQTAFRNVFNDIIKTLKAYVSKNLRIKKLITKNNELASQDFTIVGVYFDINKDDFKVNYPQDRVTNDQKVAYLKDRIKNISELYPVIVNENVLSTYGVYLGQGEYSRIVAPLSTNGNSKVVANQLNNNNGLVLSWFRNTVLSTLAENEDIIKQASQLFLYVAIILALFSIFMLFNYISVSIVSKRQAIGVLRALGCNGKDVFRMFISESLIIAFINSILAVVISLIGCIFVNSYVKNVMTISANFALYSYRQVIFTIVLCFVTAIISSIIPIVKICKEKPVKLIREP